ncbi:unnamed protein product [Paramecium octaurelia]|uniref:Uncharacterized protein n=1 Tax=Paramecium octaurelia TaxID=43137 RepID=A0A8S1WNU0_PAROT|nr:unnamed protein product [Paramecium octaurelia]
METFKLIILAKLNQLILSYPLNQHIMAGFGTNLGRLFRSHQKFRVTYLIRISIQQGNQFCCYQNNPLNLQIDQSNWSENLIKLLKKLFFLIFLNGIRDLQQDVYFSKRLQQKRIYLKIILKFKQQVKSYKQTRIDNNFTSPQNSKEFN